MWIRSHIVKSRLLDLQHCNTRNRLGKSGLVLYSQYCKAPLYRDPYFNRIIVHLWDALPRTLYCIQSSEPISSFKRKLKAFYHERLNFVFDGVNFTELRRYKLPIIKYEQSKKLLKCLWNGWKFFLKLCWFYSLKYAEYHAVFYFRPAIR
jgi:hypothetical protein